MDVVADEGCIEQNAEPFARKQEQEVEENVQDVPEKFFIEKNIFLFFMNENILVNTHSGKTRGFSEAHWSIGFL